MAEILVCVEILPQGVGVWVFVWFFLECNCRGTKLPMGVYKLQTLDFMHLFRCPAAVHE